MTLQRYYRLAGFGFYVIAIFLFSPFVVSAALGTLAIGTHEKMTVSNYFILLGEIFMARGFVHFPAVGLIIGGLILNKKANAA